MGVVAFSQHKPTHIAIVKFSKILQDIHHVVTSAEHNSTMQLSLADELDVGKKDIRKGIHVVQTYVRESIVAATSTPLDRMTNLMKAFVLMFALRSVSPQPSYDADFDGWLPHRPVPMPKSFELQSMERAFVDMINGRKSWSPRPLICLCRYYDQTIRMYLMTSWLTCP